MLANMHGSFRFRHQHWGMVKKYIIDNTKYPKATGGTPITTWLPNQMGACLEQCQLLMDKIREEDLNESDLTDYRRIKGEVDVQIRELFQEVHGLQSEVTEGQEHAQFQTRDKN